MKRLLISLVNRQPSSEITAPVSVSTPPRTDMHDAVTEVIPIQRREQHLTSRAVTNEELANWSLTGR